MNREICIESWKENQEDILNMLCEVDCLDIFVIRQDRDTIIARARTNLIGLFRLFKRTFNRPEMRLYFSFN